MRALLAVLDHLDTAPSVLAAALLVARRLGVPLIEVLHVCAASDPSFMPTEEVMTPQRQAHFLAHEAARSAALHTLFAAWQPKAAPTRAVWREEVGEKAEHVARGARTTDLIVIGRAHHEPGDGRTAIEAALFAAAAPILLVPPTAPATLGTHIAVAWQPSGPAERAVVAATPLLRAAERVTVLIGTDNDIDRKPAEALIQSLAGLPWLPQTRCFAPGGEPIGPALLREARKLGADLLVMGAYAHRRSVEVLLGGATRGVLAAADMPVFLHH
jgi:nucleotide-binding universal stress UspA family protein